MKVQLIVTSPGANQGRAIPIIGTQFLIGRDQDCQLRPASPAISKKHCGIFIKDGQVTIKDLGSTNGTQVNGVTIESEVVVENGAALKAGPLEFKVEITEVKRKTDSTPLPEQLKPLSDAEAKLRAAAGTAAQKSKSSTTVKPAAKTPAADPDQDAAAALLMGLDDDDSSSGSPPSIPEGSTVMELPAVDAAAVKEAEDKKKKKSVSGAEMSATANDILRRYIRRTGGNS
jgi:pSer/pThr/pTyr-binding forkhead associated (FHA) protein